MSTSTIHPVEPETVMAFLDGELSSAQECDVSNHIERCVECAHLAAQIGGVSQSLSLWKVPAIRTELEQTVTYLATKTAAGPKTRRAGLFISTSLWTWKQWAAAGGGAMATLFLVLAISLPTLQRSSRSRLATAPGNGGVGYMDYSSAKTRQMEREGSAGKFQAEKQQVMEPKSGPMTLSARGIVADSNGQVVDDKQSDVSPAPMIARTVSLSIVVKDFALCRSSLDTILDRHHGYPEQLNVSTPENAPRTLHATLRIPAPRLSPAASELKALGRVENESQSGEEVTKQHTDLVARLKNSRDTEQRLRAILQQRTGKVADILQVEEEIARVRGDVERMEGEQKALEHRVDFATIELEVTEEYKAQLNPPAASVSTRMHNAFVAGYHNASETVFGTVLFFAEYGPTFLVWTAVLALPGVLLWRRYRRAMASV